MDSSTQHTLYLGIIVMLDQNSFINDNTTYNTSTNKSTHSYKIYTDKCNINTISGNKMQYISM